MQNIFKILLSILLLLCLIDMPYGFYQFVRFAAMIGFAIFAYQMYEQGKQQEMIIYICLLVLFQPLLKISLGRTLWNIIDVVVSIGLLYTVFFKKTKR